MARKPEPVYAWTWLSPENKIKTAWGVWRSKGRMAIDPSRVLTPLGWKPVRVRIEVADE